MTNSRTEDGTSIDDLQARVLAGVVFETNHIFDIANGGGDGTMLFRTGDRPVIIYLREVVTNGDEFEYQAFRAPTLTADGTPLQITNRNEGAQTVPQVQAFHTPTITADGEALPPVYLPGSVGVGQTSNGQFGEDGAIRLLSANTDYLARLTNNGAAAAGKGQIYLMWAEI